jgi:hypothetical protein
MIRRLIRFLFYREVPVSLAHQIQQLKDFEAALDGVAPKLQAFEADVDRVARKWDALRGDIEGDDVAEQTARLKRSTDSLAGSVQANQ